MYNRRTFMTMAGGVSLAALTGCARKPGPAFYKVARDPLPVRDQFPIILNSNENPLGPCPSAIEAASRAVMDLSHRYAREHRERLVADLADFHSLNPDQILLGCGAIELLKIATDVFCSEGNLPIISDPVYEAIDYFAGLRHISPIKVPAGKGGTGHDLQAMLDAVYTSGGMVYVCNPCNPTGSVLGRKELVDFLRQIPEEVIVIVDEAYAEYVEPEFFSSLEYVRSGMPNLVVMRTFSKIYGLAGLRVGYCAGDRRLIGAMAGHRLWNNINQAGAAAAREALRDPSWADRVRRENEKTRSMFCRGLERLGIGYIPSRASYVLISPGVAWEEAHGHLKSRGIMAGRKIPSMPLHVRVSIGSPAEMDYCIDVLKELRLS